MISFTERIWGYEYEVTDPMQKMGMVISAVKKLQIVDVLHHYGVKFVRGGGSRYLSLCPFHMDNHIGSFSADTAKNTCYCYACATGGDAIGAVAKMFHLSWKEAVLQIAADEGLIDTDVYEELSDIEYVCKKTATSNFYFTKKHHMACTASVTKDTETLKMWTEIYEFVKKEWTITKPHLDILMNTRQLSQERIDKDYFTMRSADPVAVASLVLQIKRRFPEYADKLSTVPGFFEQLMVNGRWEVSMLQYSGIGILLRDADGYVAGVQVRMDKKDRNGLRYKYFSHEFEKMEYVRGGGSCGTPIDVCYPGRITGNTKVCVTEGRFKAEILARQGLISLSVQGVNNFAGIESVIKDIERKIGRKVPELYVFYDADLMHNVQVYKAAIALASYMEELKPNTIVSFAVWAEVFGKGIDDMILAGYRNETKCVMYQRFKDVYEKAIQEASDVTGIDPVKVARLSKEERTKFLDAFGKAAECRLL